MTYGELKAVLEKLNPEQLQMDISVYVGDVDEIFPCREFIINDDEAGFGALDEGHPLFISGLERNIKM